VAGANAADGEASPLASEALRVEALRVNARYIEEVVIGWDLCPWAARAWAQGEVERRVLAAAAPDPAEVARVIRELGAVPTCAVGLLIFPRAEVSVGAWERFAEQARRAAGPFVIAAFHPDYRPSERPVTNAAELVSLIRRTPDPTLQLVRTALIDELAGGGRDVSGEIARRNFAAVSARDPSLLAALLDELRRDRDRAYAKLAGVTA
jgi:hypothetical protein